MSIFRRLFHPRARPVEATSFRPAFFALALLLFAASAWAVWDEAVTRRPYKAIQARFAALPAARHQKLAPDGIRQVTNPALGVADRCETCHLAIDRPGFEDPSLPLVFRTHPRRAELLGKRHPAQSIGCTPCHGGQGLQTKGVAGEPFAHGRDDRHWEKPLHSRPFIESSCGACHGGEGMEIPGAPIYERGRWLFEHRRCGGCHAIRDGAPRRQLAPPLDRLKVKTSQRFVEEWLRDPGAIRSDAKMPSFWPVPVEPADGAPSPTGSKRHESWLARRAREPAAIAAYLGSVSESTLPTGVPSARSPVPSAADPGRGAIGASTPEPPASAEWIAQGRALFDGLGCRGCHALSEPGAPPAAREALFGPGLDGLGERASARWIRAWLADPRSLWPKGRMPNLRLSDDELDRLTAFLASLRREGRPPVALDWPGGPPELIAEGKRAIQLYGCAGCHGIPGIPAAGRPGPDLDDFGDKPPDHLEWGEARVRCDVPALECWTQEKLARPRRMDGRTVKPVMPDSRLSSDDALALSVFVMANREARGARVLGDAARAVSEGERVLARHNCRGCHEIGRDEERVLAEDGSLIEIRYHAHGGAVRRFYAEAALAPPPLTFAGRKLQAPWLFDFLGSPVPVRRWLTARMPSFALDDKESNALVLYFAAKEGAGHVFEARTPDVPEDRRDGGLLFEKLQCEKCHGDSVLRGVKLAERAPDLALASRRLKRGWVESWLEDPQRLQPGTRMPTYFPLADDDDPKSRITPFPQVLGGDVARQVRALADVTMRQAPDRERAVRNDSTRITTHGRYRP